MSLKYHLLFCVSCEQIEKKKKMFAWEKFYSKKAVGEAGNPLSEIKVLPLVMIL